MVDLKGGDVLVRATAAANRELSVPIHLVLAGEGPERQRWTDRAANHGIKVTSTGWVSGGARVAAFRNASVLAVPSLFPEPFGLVGLEAAAHGVPAVAFDVGGIRQWLHDDVNGRLVAPRGSAGAFGATLGALLRNTADLQRLGAGARRTAASFSIDTHLDVLERVFLRATGQAKAQRVPDLSSAHG
jgi:glycosyltransferase involved in cell wall biosynthesis